MAWLSRPRETTIERAVRTWHASPPPDPLDHVLGLDHAAECNPLAVADNVAGRLRSARDAAGKARLERAALEWLRSFIRLNVKRGRVFLLSDVLRTKQADCLGYALLLEVIGRPLGLDVGIVEVVIDNAGRYVPHVANLLKPADGRVQVADLWYGSTDINHRRLGLRVREGRSWVATDMDTEDINRAADVRGLSPRMVDGISCYILGNRRLAQGLRDGDRVELTAAVEYYGAGILRYPQNARFYFNRAVAYENLGDHGKAAADYAVAFKDESSQTRVLAREYEESTRLIRLDEIGLVPHQEEAYLLSRGFITGAQEPPDTVAAACGMTPQAVVRTVARIESALSQRL